MNLLHRLFVWIIALVLVLICVGIWGVSLNSKAANWTYTHGYVIGENEDGTTSVVVNRKWVVFGSGLVLLALALLLIATLPRRVRKGGVLSYTQEGSTVQIARRAVEDFVTKLGSQMEGIADMTCWVDASSELICVNVRISIDVGRISIPDASRMVKNTIEEEMRGTLGFTNIGEVNVVVDKLPRSGKYTPPAVPTVPAITDTTGGSVFSSQQEQSFDNDPTSPSFGDEYTSTQDNDEPVGDDEKKDEEQY
jgi:hypothetical protein